MIITFLIGRIIFGLYLLDNARNHLVHMQNMAAYAASKKVPQPKLAVFLSGLLLLVGAVTMLTGLLPWLGLTALIVFFVPVSLIMHNYWKMEGDARMMQRIQFMKNMAILGAVLMMFMLPTPWLYSLVW